MLKIIFIGTVPGAYCHKQNFRVSKLRYTAILAYKIDGHYVSKKCAYVIETIVS